MHSKSQWIHHFEHFVVLDLKYNRVLRQMLPERVQELGFHLFRSEFGVCQFLETNAHSHAVVGTIGSDLKTELKSLETPGKDQKYQ